MSFFGVYDGHGGRAVAKFCAKYLHLELVKQEAYIAGDLPSAARKAFLRMTINPHFPRPEDGGKAGSYLKNHIYSFQFVNSMSHHFYLLLWQPKVEIRRKSYVADNFMEELKHEQELRERHNQERARNTIALHIYCILHCINK